MAIDITQFDGTFALDFLRNDETVSLYGRNPLTIRICDSNGEKIMDVVKGEWIARTSSGLLERVRVSGEEK